MQISERCWFPQTRPLLVAITQVKVKATHLKSEQTNNKGWFGLHTEVRTNLMEMNFFWWSSVSVLQPQENTGELHLAHHHDGSLDERQPDVAELILRVRDT